MAEWTLLGQCRQSRKYTTYKNCPLPTPADRLLFILVYLKQNTIQTLHGRLFGMRQSKANHWIHVLLPVVRNTLRTTGRCALSHGGGLAPTTGGGGAAPVTGVLRVGVLRVGRYPSRGPPFCHDGTERPIPRPQDPTPQQT